MKYLLATLLLFLSTSNATAFAVPFSCPFDDWSEAQLATFKQSEYVIDSEKIDQFALDMLGCLASPNSDIRDGLGYMVYSKWLRGGQLSVDSVAKLHTQLSADIQTKKNDSQKVYLPFAVLVYAEVIRVDRVKPYLTDQQLDDTVSLVALLLQDINDYRGFESNIGWRHLVAHSADAALQLVLNKRLTKAHHDKLLDGLFSQVSPKQHSYTFGESKRLVLPILYSWMAGKHQLPEWQTRLDGVIDPAPFANWGEVFNSEAGLHKQHNTRLFLLELYRSISFNDVVRLNALAPSVKKALSQLR